MLWTATMIGPATMIGRATMIDDDWAAEDDEPYDVGGLQSPWLWWSVQAVDCGGQSRDSCKVWERLFAREAL